MKHLYLFIGLILLFSTQIVFAGKTIPLKNQSIEVNFSYSAPNKDGKMIKNAGQSALTFSANQDNWVVITSTQSQKNQQSSPDFFVLLGKMNNPHSGKIKINFLVIAMNSKNNPFVIEKSIIFTPEAKGHLRFKENKHDIQIDVK